MFSLKKKILVGLMLGATAVAAFTSLAFAADSNFTHADSNLRISGSTTAYPIVQAALSIPGKGGYSDSGAFQGTGAGSGCKAEVYQGGTGQARTDLDDNVISIGMASSTKTG